MASSKAMGTAMGHTSKAAGNTLQGVSKSAAAMRSSSSTGPPTLERMQQPATERPWNRPGKAPPAQLMMPVGGLMDDQLEFQNSVFWTPEILNAVQDLVEEEALFYKITLKSDRWDHLTMDGCRWLVRYHGGARVQRFHPEHRSCPEEIENLREEGGERKVAGNQA